jgi:molybdopterin molybdotransferase
MAQLSNDCFAAGAKRRMTAAEALDLLGERLDVVAESETIGLRAAPGRILAADVVSTRAVPPHDNSAVDGYAIRFDDLSQVGETKLKIAGRAAPAIPSKRRWRPTPRCASSPARRCPPVPTR